MFLKFNLLMKFLRQYWFFCSLRRKWEKQNGKLPRNLAFATLFYVNIKINKYICVYHDTVIFFTCKKIASLQILF